MNLVWRFGLFAPKALIGASNQPVGTHSSRSPHSTEPLEPDQEEESAERHAVDVILGLAGLDAAQAVARVERPRAQEVQHAVDDVAVHPANQARNAEEHPAVDDEERVV